ncbi:MAG: zinc-dependent peptidase, partial [Polyangiaceae bacterium]
MPSLQMAGSQSPWLQSLAAQACLLLLHRDNDMYPNVEAILVYPSAYKAPSRRDGGGFIVEDQQARLG